MDANPIASTSVLTPELITSFRPAKVFKNHNQVGKSYTALSFEDRGEFVITSNEDETMQLFNCKTGKHTKVLNSKKYGVDLARFTHKNSAIIHASTKGDDGIRYLSLHDNNYLRYFKGHKKRVVSLEMSPQDDTFLSGSIDDTVRLWDLRTQHAAGLLNIAGYPAVAYDPAGTVFAVSLNIQSTLLLYDLKNFDKQPFLSISIIDPILPKLSHPPRIPIYTNLKFSNDGKFILLGTSAEIIYVLDAFEGGIMARLDCPVPTGLERDIAAPYTRPMAPSVGIAGSQLTWSPDGRYVISGSIDGKIHIWDVFPPGITLPYSSEFTLAPLRSLEGHLGGPSRVLGFNPKSAMMVSAGNDLAFWLPTL